MGGIKASKAARNRLLSQQAICYDVDGSRPGKKRWVVGVGAHMRDSREEGLAIDTIALIRAARKIKSGQHASGSTPSSGVYQNPSSDNPVPTYEDPNDGWPDESYPASGPDSDIGSDDDEDPYTVPSSAIVAAPTIYTPASLIPYAAVSRTVHPTRSRFQSWHNKIAQIFDIAFGSLPPSDTPLQLDCSCPIAVGRKDIYITVYDVDRPRLITAKCCYQHLIPHLLRSSLFPATPSRPEVAFSMTLLRWLQTLVDHTGLGANNMAMTLESFVRRGTGFQQSRTPFDVPDTLRKQLRSALTWLTVLDRYATQMALACRPTWVETRPFIDEDHLSLTLENLADSCPACFGSFQKGSPSIPGSADGPQIIISIDGNFTQKRRSRVDSVGKQPFPPRRFLSHAQVQRAATEWDRTSGSDPDKDSCIANIRAIDNQAAHHSNNPFDITGLMGACCRHDVPLVMCDMRTPGERHYYAIALIRALIAAIGPHLNHLGVAYDIGCRFAPSTKVQRLFSSDNVRISWAVPVFHVYGHTYTCQLRYSPRNLSGFGFTDGEGMERVWSSLTNLITTTRNMSEGERRFALEERCEFVATERRLTHFSSLRSKETRLLAAARQARETITPAFNPSSIPPHLALPSMTQQHSSSHTTYFAELRTIDGTLCDSLQRMSADRARTLERIASQRRQPKPDTLAAVPIFAGNLLRILAEIRLLQSILFNRPSTAHRGTGPTVRLSLCLKNEKAAARKAMSKLNVALADEHPEDSEEAAPQLEKESLFDEATFLIVEEWANESDDPVSTAWWARPDVAQAINAFETLLRVSEERGRMQHERESAFTWIAARIEKLKALKSSHSVYRDALRDAEYLQRHWNGEADFSSVLRPVGGLCLSTDDEDAHEHDDIELITQVQLLAVDEASSH